ncbi:MAG: hypothetical protein AB7P04_04255 [Bacteriovoracia bacterium]
MGKLLLGLFAGTIVYLCYQSGCAWTRGTPRITRIETRALDASADPAQVPLSGETTIPLSVPDANLQAQPVATYRVAARVLSTRTYYMEWQRHISPVDVALGWGKLATPSHDSGLRFDHGERFYHFYIDPGASLNSSEVYLLSSNHHLVPANRNIDRAIRRLSVGDLVELEGWLVNISGTRRHQEFQWNTSLRRDDQGGGACEILYVKHVRVGNQVYE